MFRSESLPGADKIRLERVARETLAGMREDRYEVRVEIVGILDWPNRPMPRVAGRILWNA